MNVESSRRDEPHSGSNPPRSHGTQKTVYGLNKRVYIRRDEYGIPHVEAENEADAWFGTGYACAEDRMWQLEWYRLRGQGRWAEVVGKTGVEEDIFFRKMDLVATSMGDVAAMSPETKAMFDSYAAGVNAYLQSASDLPEEYVLTGIAPETWEPWHSVLLFKVRHAVMGKWQLKLARTQLIQRIGAEKYSFLESLQADGQNVLVPPCEVTSGTESPSFEGADSLGRLAARLKNWVSVEGGSNSWVVQGSRVTTGKPVLCNDSHRPLDVPNVYWQVQVRCPGFNAAGGAFPGYPAFPHFGHTESVGWCITHGMADNQDLYLEKFNQEDPSLYLTEDGWKKTERTVSVIKVRDGEPFDLEIRRTRHGVVIQDDAAKGWGLSLSYTATDRTNRQAECLRLMIKAKTVDELIESQREWVEPVNNFLCADVSDGIGYLTRGRLPVRSTPDGRQFIVPGWTDEHKWIGDVPFEELPRIVNPPGGFIATANQRIQNGEDPYIAHEFAPASRAERIVELLKGTGVMSAEEIASIQGDTVSVRALGWSGILESLPDRFSLDAPADSAKKLLSGWDGNLLPGSCRALLYGFFRRELAHKSIEPIVGGETWKWLTDGNNPGGEFLLESWLYNLGDRACKLGVETPLPDGRLWENLLPDVLSAAWRKTVALTGSEEPESWSWGPHHKTCAQHTLAEIYPDKARRLNPPSVEMGGDGDTIQVSSYSLSGGAPRIGSAGHTSAAARDLGVFPVQSISVYRQFIDFSDTGGAKWVIPAGSSGRTGSSHAEDQLEVWLSHRLVPMYFSADDVKANAVSELRLDPGELS